MATGKKKKKNRKQEVLSGTGKDVQVMENQVTLRFAVPDDAAAIRSIYEPYVLNTAVTSEYYVPTEEEFRARITRTRERYPYIVAVKDGQIIGYIYASPLSPRHAYSWAAETSIYIRQNVRRTGAGSRLYKALSAICRKQNVLNLYARIAFADPEDEFLVNASARFHEAIGFRKAAEFHRVFHKFGRWYNAIWMEKLLGDHDEGAMPEVIPFPELYLTNEDLKEY